MGDVDTALERMARELPDYRIYSMGEAPPPHLRGRFFCGLERRARGALHLGYGRTLAAAIVQATELATEDKQSGGVALIRSRRGSEAHG